MGGITALKKVQIGRETTAGTAVAATYVLRGKADIKDAREFGTSAEDIGQLFPKNRMYEKFRLGIVTMPDQEATFETITYILAAAVENVVTGTADGTGSGKIYEFNHGVTSVNTPRTFTIEVGDNQRVDEMEYAFVRQFTLKGAAKDAIRFSAEWVGKQVSDAEFTAGLTPTTVEEIVFGKANLYLDASGGTIGTTTKTSTFLGFTLTDKTGHDMLFTGDGALTPVGIQTRVPTITGTLILEHDATGEAELGYARSNAIRLMRIKVTGSTLTTAGTSYSVKTFQFSAAIQYDSVPQTADKDGDQVIELPFHVIDSDSIVPTFIVVNEAAAVL